MNGRKFVVGDIHGGYLSLINLLEQVNFDYENDHLISLGDVCDGWSQVPESIELLMSIKNLTYVRGNHDEWTIKFLTKPRKFTDYDFDEYCSWLAHGGKSTLLAYEEKAELIEKHLTFLKNSKLFHIEDKNLFIHAGYHETSYRDGTLIEGNFHHDEIYMWDRKFWEDAYMGRNVGKEFNIVFIGHTPTLNYPKSNDEHFKPLFRGNVVNVDTGSAFTGKLSMIEIVDNELIVYQSEKRTMEYYPNEYGRNGSKYNSN